MRWSGCSACMSTRIDHRPTACCFTAMLVRSLVIAAVFGSQSLLVNAQPFIRSLVVLHDSVPVDLEHAHEGSRLPPLNIHCVCMRIPTGTEGRVLIELLEVSPNGLASFFGYASNGRLWSCFKTDAIAFRQGSLLFEERKANLMAIRRPTDTRFR